MVPQAAAESAGSARNCGATRRDANIKKAPSGVHLGVHQRDRGSLADKPKYPALNSTTEPQSVAT